MKPIYFPFTYISNEDVFAVNACFPQVVVYQPTADIPEQMQGPTDNGTIELKTPIAGDDDRLFQLCREYRNWMDIHHGVETSILKAGPSGIPFFDEFSSFQIRDTVRQKQSNHQTEKHDPLFNARLFLLLTQEYDAQEHEIHRDFQYFNTKEKNLFQSLKGDEDFYSDETDKNYIGPFSGYDQGKHMTEKRLDAWSRLLFEDRDIPGLFLTTSRSVFEHMVGNTPEVEKILQFDKIPVPGDKTETFINWQNDLAAYLELFLKTNPQTSEVSIPSPPDIACDQSAALTIYNIPDKTPVDLFTRFIKDNSPGFVGNNATEINNNTLIGFIET